MQARKKQTGKNGEERYTIKGADYDAIIGSANEALFVFLDLMLRNGLKEDTTVILVSDGADWIQEINKKILKPLGVHVIAINDLYHTKQNIGLFCKYVNEKIEGKEKGYENTLPLDANLISKLVENGEIDEALVILRLHESLKAKNLVNAYSYINDRRDRMNYPSFKKMGFIIGSGPVESSNKYYVQDRLVLEGYSARCKYYNKDSNFNIQIAVFDNQITVASPIIYGSY